jgi:preprotein translocase subunit SecA
VPRSEAAQQRAIESARSEFLESEEEPTAPIRNESRRIGRNDPCPCGSGKKFKKCCGRRLP